VTQQQQQQQQTQAYTACSVAMHAWYRSSFAALVLWSGARPHGLEYFFREVLCLLLLLLQVAVCGVMGACTPTNHTKCLLLLLLAAAAAGGSVWCDEGMYPRKLFVEMKGGRAVWRCACFKEMGWSDVRKVNTRTSLLQHACQITG
jgi:hypothetical protein